MRQHHPDQASNDGFDSNSFCALLNQIYQVKQVPHVCSAMLIASRSCIVVQMQWCCCVFKQQRQCSESTASMYAVPHGSSSTCLLPRPRQQLYACPTQPNTLSPHPNPTQPNSTQHPYSSTQLNPTQHPHFPTQSCTMLCRRCLILMPARCTMQSLDSVWTQSTPFGTPASQQIRSLLTR